MGRKKTEPISQMDLIDTNGMRTYVRRTRRPLFLPRLLSKESADTHLMDSAQDQAREVVSRWIRTYERGGLSRKETSLDAEFLHEIFSDALDYKPSTQGENDYSLERNFSVPDVGTADGALGLFRAGHSSAPHVVIELKDAEVNLDRDRFNGRTPVQQLWDYLNALPGCSWGILSNFITIRLYHRNRTPQVYQEFRLLDLKDERRFQEFYYLFEKGGLLPTALGRSRAVGLLELSEQRQREVGDSLYKAYSGNRLSLIDHLKSKQGKTLEQSVHIAQKILDRIVFIAFCEDRGLLPPAVLKKNYEGIPPFPRVTNPRWRNFLDLFHAMDQGHPDLELQEGYDGGLFKRDAEVDDLQLDDGWTDFFRDIGTYDFRDEVNVEVLGHLFEKSITELERIRLGGLLDQDADDSSPEPAMKKSAQRKRQGIFYTAKDFTKFIVDRTLGEIIEKRLADLAVDCGVDPEDDGVASPKLAGYWRRALEEVRRIKVCDPACGSGAFLIAAYDLLEDQYQNIIDSLIIHEGPDRTALNNDLPDWILNDNLYGVDLSEQAVEITRLALWIRSARRNRTLNDLSRNILCGNSLVIDKSVDPRAFVWREAFPCVFQSNRAATVRERESSDGAPTVKEGNSSNGAATVRERKTYTSDDPLKKQRPLPDGRGSDDCSEGGFDCVIGNPPWERLKLQEREFFAYAAPAIASAVSAETRRTQIEKLKKKDPDLFTRYEAAKTQAENVLAHVRQSGEFPLTAQGDINTYMLFAELARKIVSPGGLVGILVPSGIATDMTTKEFFNQVIEDKSLILFYDFENKEGIFPDVHRSYKFCTLIFGGSKVKTKQADYFFFAHNMDDLEEQKRHIKLTAEDFALFNPNTRTCPIFRTRRDAELTKYIYNRVPILVDKNRRSGGNPWGIRFVRMFDQTNDAALFKTGDDLKKLDYKLTGNRWVKKTKTFLPLYEAKMFRPYDHRFGSVYVKQENWVNQGQTDETTLVKHQNTDFVVLPRWWIEENEILKRLPIPSHKTLLAFRDVTRATDDRTMLATFIPFAAVVNTAPLIVFGESITPRQQCCLTANLNSRALDCVAKQKVGHIHMNFFILEQLPMFSPDFYEDRCPCDKKTKLVKWMSDRVLKLTCTAEDMRPLGEACDLDPPVHKWKEPERQELMAELDAAYFILYGIKRDDAIYILSTFQGLTDGGRIAVEDAPTVQRILEHYDRLSKIG